MDKRKQKNLMRVKKEVREKKTLAKRTLYNTLYNTLYIYTPL